MEKSLTGITLGKIANDEIIYNTNQDRMWKCPQK